MVPASPLRRFACLAASLLLVPAALAQFSSPMLDFESDPKGNPENEEMFRSPTASPTTSAFVLASSSDPFFLTPASFRSLDVVVPDTPGIASLEVRYWWADPQDGDSWVRLTTTNGAIYPNPIVHVDGVIEFDILNAGDGFGGGSPIGVCLGIRETDVAGSLFGNGGGTGPIEWVGMDATAAPPGLAGPPAPAIELPPSATPVRLRFELATGRVFKNGEEITPGGLSATTVGFTGDGIVDTPTGYAVLEHIAITLAPGAVFNEQVVRLAIDEFVATAPIPDAPAIVAPIVAGDPTVTVTGLASATDTVTLFRNEIEEVSVAKTPGDPGDVEVTLLSPAESDDVFTATQSLSTVPGAESLLSNPVTAGPIPAPAIVSPILAGANDVTVTNILDSANYVELWRDGVLYDFVNKPVDDDQDIIFTLPLGEEAVVDETFTARQSRSGVVGPFSAFSAGETVIAGPPEHGFALLIDNNGTNSASTADWEWVPVSSTTQENQDWEPQDARPVAARDAVWQLVDIDLTDDSRVDGTPFGDGELGASPSGFYTLDSIWFAREDGAVIDTTYEVLVDAVEFVDAGGVVTAKVLEFEDNINYFPIRRGQSEEDPTISQNTTLGSFDGTTSHLIQWQYNGQGQEAVGLFNDPPGDGRLRIPDDTATIRFRLCARGPRLAPDTPLPVVQAPIITGSTRVRVQHDPAATAVTLYVDGVAVATDAAPSGEEALFNNVTLSDGASVSATQVVDGVTSDFAYPRGVTGPTAPFIADTQLVPGQTTVTVRDLNPDAELVSVLSDGSVIQTADPAGAAEFTVTGVPSLLDGASITVTQTVNGVSSAESAAVVVGPPVPTVVSPVLPGATTVTIEGVHPLADTVTLYIDDSPQAFVAASPVTVVGISGASSCQQFEATQTISTIESPRSLPVFTPQYAEALVVINEFVIDDNGVDNQEFVELYNDGSTALDISGWTLRNSDFAFNPDGSDNNLDFVVDDGVVLQPGDFYVLGSDEAPGVDQIVDGVAATGAGEGIWENGWEMFDLLDLCGNPIDAVQYGAIEEAAPPDLPGEGAPVHGRLWTNYALVPHSYSRWFDGFDTQDNNFDFGARPATPGASNEQGTAIYYSVPTGSPGATVPGINGQWIQAFFVDPTSTANDNPYVIPAPPANVGNGNAAIFWDPAGGSNNYHSQDLLLGAAFDWVQYFDTARLASGSNTFWTIGLAGSAINTASNQDAGNDAGQTGVLWDLNRRETGDGSLTNNDGVLSNGEYSLALIDATDAGGRPGWTTLFRTSSLENDPDDPAGGKVSGWYRLGIAVDPQGNLLAVFDDQVIRGQVDPGLLGSLHIVYDDENFGGVPGANWRPPTVAGDFDSNENGIPDLGEIVTGAAADCNLNALPDDGEEFYAGPVLGDYNADALTNESELFVLETCLAGPGNATTGLLGCATICTDAFDYNGDSAVDLADVANLQQDIND